MKKAQSSLLFRLGAGAGILLLILLLASFAGAEQHVVSVRCAGSGFVGRRNGEMLSLVLTPETAVKAADGSIRTLESLFQLPGFELRGASLRWIAEDVRGLEEYFLSCGKAHTDYQTVQEGWNLWDITAPFSIWMRGGNAPLCLSPAHWKNGRGMTVAADSAIVQFAFTADEELPLFPADRIEENPVYDAGLALLEADSPFIRRYDDTAGSLLSATLPLGVPYYYAGRNEEKFLKRYRPETTTNYYRGDRMYLYGLDCVGMTRLVYRQSGLKRHPSILSILHRAVASAALKAADPSAWPALLRPGDLIGVEHGTYHIMMYLGTMRQFGWTDEEAGEAAEILDAPLVLHCGMNPFYYDRYLQYIRENGYQNTYPPDGGVTVSVIQRTDRAAPRFFVSAWGEAYGWYEADGKPLTVFPLADCTKIAWYGAEKRVAEDAEEEPEPDGTP